MFELSPRRNDWTEKVVYSFKLNDAGWNPTGNLIFDRRGNLYGTLSQGLNRTYCGAVFDTVSAEVEAKDLQAASSVSESKSSRVVPLAFECIRDPLQMPPALDEGDETYQPKSNEDDLHFSYFWLNEWQTSIGASTTASPQSVTEEDPQLGTPIKPLAPKNSMSQFREMSEVKHRKSATPRARSISGPGPFVAYQADRNLLGKYRLL